MSKLLDRLESELRSAMAEGDYAKARTLRDKYLTQQDKERASTVESYGLGVKRGLGRYGAQAQRLVSLAYGAMDPEEIARRNRIAEQERQADAAFKQQTANHPLAALFGEMTPATIISGGRSPVTGMLRGAAAGFGSYVEDPNQQLLQGLIGGGAGAMGAEAQKLLTPFGRRTQRMGMKATPEETGITFLPKGSVRDMNAFRVQAFKNAKENQKTITMQALDELGVGDYRFTGETLENAKNKASELFSKALGSKERLVVTDYKFLDDFAEAENRLGPGRKAASKWAMQIKNDIEKNNGTLPVEKYQQLRSDITSDIISATKSVKQRTLGSLIDWLDDKAAKNLSQETIDTFNQARSRWKTYTMFEQLGKRRGGIDYETGLIDPNKLESVLTNKDTQGFLLNKNNTKLYDLVRLNREIAGRSDINASPQNTLGGLRGTMGGQGMQLYVNRGILEPLGSFGLGVNRLPGSAVGDAIPGSVPALGGLLRDEFNVTMPGQQIPEEYDKSILQNLFNFSN